MRERERLRVDRGRAGFGIGAARSIPSAPGATRRRGRVRLVRRAAGGARARARAVPAASARSTRCRASSARRSSRRPTSAPAPTQLADELDRDPTRSGPRSRPASTRWSRATAASSSTSWPAAGQVMKRPAYGDESRLRPRAGRAGPRRARASCRGDPPVAQVEPRRHDRPDRDARERPAPGAHVRRHQHGVLADRARCMRRAGRIFIRRDIKDAAVYRWVLRQYLGYLVEKRFTLEWYIEGTRSRTGKLGPPKMGLLRYIVDAVPRGPQRRRRDGAGLDRLRPAPRGRRVRRRGARRAEGDGSRLAWMVRNFRAQRRHRGGRIYVRFGEPLSLRAAVHPDADGRGGRPRAAEARVRGRAPGSTR